MTRSLTSNGNRLTLGILFRHLQELSSTVISRRTGTVLCLISTEVKHGK